MPNDKSKNNKQKIEAGLKELSEKIQSKSKEVADKLPVLGHVSWLYSQLESHQYLSFRDIESKIMPALLLEQCKLYLLPKASGLPMAFISWAKLNETAEDKFIATQKLAPGDWKSGDHIWVTDVIAPWGGQEKIFKELYHQIFKDQDVYLLLPKSGGGFQKTTLGEVLGLSNDDRVNDNDESPDETPLAH